MRGRPEGARRARVHRGMRPRGRWLSASLALAALVLTAWPPAAAASLDGSLAGPRVDDTLSHAEFGPVALRTTDTRSVAQSGASRPLDPAHRVADVGDSTVAEIQGLLSGLGYPVGPVDGVFGPRTAQGLCAWRRLEGLDVHRGALGDGELERLRAAEGLPEAEPGIGVTIDKTCQTLYLRDDGRWEQVLTASTGRGGLPRVSDYTIRRTRAGWHTSTLYPSPQPNMYNTLYFSGVIAIHGSHHVPPRPVSAGCVRVTPASADLLFSRLGVGDPVTVIGAF